MKPIMDIRALISGMKSTANDALNEIKSATFKEKYGASAEKLYTYSKRVLTLEGIVDSELETAPTATDLMLAKAISKDVIGNGWEGSGQVMNKIFSIFLGRNLNAKSNGVHCRIDLPKGTIIKTKSGKIGMISEKSNLMVISGSSLTKHTSFDKMNQDMNLPTLDEITIFIGTILSDPALLRNLSSAMKISSLEEFDNMIAISTNGLDTEKSDQMEYKKFFAGQMNPEITLGDTA